MASCEAAPGPRPTSMAYRVAFVHQAFEFLGVEAVAASLNRAGFEVGLAFDPRLFDDTYLDRDWLRRVFEQSRQTIEKAVALDADVYLFSVVSPAHRWARGVARGQWLGARLVPRGSRRGVRVGAQVG